VQGYNFLIMRHYIYLLLVVFLVLSCEKPIDCVKSAGVTVLKEVPVTDFDYIKVYRGIEVIITQGNEYKVQIQAGKNFIDNIEVKQEGTKLFFKDDVSCNWVRDYGQTKILVTTPELKVIYSKTDRNISCNGTVSFDDLQLIAFDKEADGEEGAGTGDFIFEINNSRLSIEANSLARFYIKGQTEEASFNIYNNDGRLDASNLAIQRLTLFHRGSNDMIVRPVESVTGILVSTGDVVLKNNPPINTLQSLFQGTVIYP
jgi:hypothetical protein